MRHLTQWKLVLRAGRCQDLDEHDPQDAGRPVARGRAGARGVASRYAAKRRGRSAAWRNCPACGRSTTESCNCYNPCQPDKSIERSHMVTDIADVAMVSQSESAVVASYEPWMGHKGGTWQAKCIVSNRSRRTVPPFPQSRRLSPPAGYAERKS